MQIKINDKILSIPPYISTNWSNIASLHMKGNLLIISLSDGNTIGIPGLPPETVELIYSYHATFLETAPLTSTPFKIIDSIEPTIRFALGSLEELGNVAQHNPAQSNAPNLPPEILEKIGTISKILLPNEAVLPKAEPSCNCFYCQIARTLNPSSSLPITAVKETHEEVSDAELKFQQWEITQTGENLYTVTNRLDTKEIYSVYLGEPVGCTCGKLGCEHVVAVLKS